MNHLVYTYLCSYMYLFGSSSLDHIHAIELDVYTRQEWKQIIRDYTILL